MSHKYEEFEGRPVDRQRRLRALCVSRLARIAIPATAAILTTLVVYFTGGTEAFENVTGRVESEPQTPPATAVAPPAAPDGATAGLKLGESERFGDPGCGAEVEVDKVQSVTVIHDAPSNPTTDPHNAGVHLTVKNIGTGCVLTERLTTELYDDSGSVMHCYRTYGDTLAEGKLLPDSWRIRPGRSISGWDLNSGCDPAGVAEVEVGIGEWGAVWAVTP